LPWLPHTHTYSRHQSDEGEIRKLVAGYFLPDGEVLQWHPTTGEDIPTPNTNEIAVFASIFQRGFGPTVYNFFHDLLDNYQIKLVYLNPNSILHITIFVHVYEAYRGVPPIFPLFKNYFFLKYQPRATNRKVIGCVGQQTLHHAGFLNLPLKNSL
jgi:hypothetical protein